MRFTKGLNKDSHPSNQPEGTYRDATNLIINKELGILTREDGTKDIPELEFSGYNIIDTLSLSTEDEFILFCDDDVIRLLDLSIPSIEDIVDTDFNFGDYIDATFTSNNEGERIIYFVDGINQPRFVNIDNNSINTVGDTSLFPSYDPTINITTEINESGGSLEAGAYYLAFRYIDSDNTRTNVFHVSKPQYIFGSSAINENIGSVGLEEGTPTSKSISIEMEGIDMSFNRIEILAIKGTTVDSIVKLDLSSAKINIATGEITINYTFSGNEGSTIGALEEVLIDNVSYDVANTLTTQNQNLYIGGLDKTGFNNQDKQELQRVALNTNVECNIKQLQNRIYEHSYSTEQVAEHLTTWKRGEVYALYISFLLEDGGETEAFHIPGRNAVSDERSNIQTSGSTNSEYSERKYNISSTPDSTYKMGYWENTTEYYPSNEPFLSEGLSGFSVIHHKIPDMYKTEDHDGNTVFTNNDHYCIVSLSLQNLDITTLDDSLKDKIVGYKLYYAKKSPENRLVLDQCTLQKGWLDREPTISIDDQTLTLQDAKDRTPDYLEYIEKQGYIGSRPSQMTCGLFSEDILTTHGFNEDFADQYFGAFPKVNYGRPADILTNNLNVQGINYVKALSEVPNPNVGEFDFAYFSGPEGTNIKEGYQNNQEQVYKVKSSATVDNNQRNINLSPQGFSYNMDNVYGESKLILEYSDELYDIDNQDPYIGHSEDGGTGDTYDVPVKVSECRVLCDLLQVQDNVHVPFYNQPLIDTGFVGYFNENNEPEGSNNKSSIEVNPSNVYTIEEDEIYGGDVYSTLNFYKAVTLIAGGSYVEYRNLRERAGKSTSDDLHFWSSVRSTPTGTTERRSRSLFDNDTLWKSDGYEGLYDVYPPINNDGGYLDWFFRNPDFVKLNDYTNPFLDGIELSESTVICNPLPVGSLFVEKIESRINTDVKFSNTPTSERYLPDELSNSSSLLPNALELFNNWTYTPHYESILPQRNKGLDLPEGSISDSLIDDLTEQQIDEIDYTIVLPQFIDSYLEYFKESDNYLTYNEEYQSLGDVKTNFPWNPNETLGDDFKNRIIRSSNKAEDGESNNFRIFLQDDFLDINRNRGSVNNLEIVNNNLIIHTDRSLIQTRGRDRLQTQQSNDVFLGSGNIFETLPNEIISTDVGFGGLQHNKNTLNIESGYIWIDNEQEEIFNLSQDGLQTLSSHEFGLYNYWNNKLSSEKNVWEIGTDRSNNRVLFVNDNTCISYYPQYQAWVSEHSFKPDKIINHLNSLYTVFNNKIHQHGDYDSLYSLDVPISLEFSIPTGVESKLSSIYYRSEGDTIDKAIVNTLNDTTGELDLEYNVSFKDAKYLSNNNLTQVRNRKGLYWINNLRSNTSSNNIRFSKNKIISNYFIIKLYNEITNKELNIIEAGAKIKQKVL